MAKECKRKKYPVLRYLSWLVIIGILLAGVSLARYTGATSGSVSAPLSRFLYSYRIADASSLTFSNMDFWLEVEGREPSATNTARSVRFDLCNYVEEGGTRRISDVALRSTLRFYAPAEFAGNLAIQLAEATDVSGVYTAITPQYLLSDLIYRVNEVQQADGSVVYETVKDESGAPVFAEGARTVSTALSENYNDFTDGAADDLEQTLTVTGGFTGTQAEHEGVVTAVAQDAQGGERAKLTLTAKVQDARYSVGFTRTVETTEGNVAPILYLDCEAQIPFYTIDIDLPEFYFEAAQPQSKTFVLFITSVNRIQNKDYSSVWGTVGDIGGASSWESLLEAPAAGQSAYTFNGAKVLGYHFNAMLPVYGQGSTVPSGETTVRITKTYDYEKGGAQLLFEHVAPISEVQGSAAIVHDIRDFYSAPDLSAAYTPDLSAVENVNGQNGAALYGLCEREGKSGYISFAGIADDPRLERYGGAADHYVFSEVLSKEYATVLNVLFAQASVNPAAGGGA